MDLAWKRDFLGWKPERPTSTTGLSTDLLGDFEGKQVMKPFRLDLLFTSDGRPKKSKLFSARALGRNQLCYIDYIFAKRETRGCGFGSRMLDMVLNTLSNMPSRDCFRGPVVLTPAEIDVNFRWPHSEGLSAQEVEERFHRHWDRLLKFYERNGFKTWSVIGEDFLSLIHI